MILNFGNVFAMGVSYRPLSRPMCFACNINTEQLRLQLDQLHSEAESTRAKANNARLRFLRLSEAAEKLQRQASGSVQKRKDNDARELLFQKKKVLQALEKSKSRIELLDELSTKLNEAISVKESQLIGHVALDLEDERKDASGPVRIVSPKQEVREDLADKLDSDVLNVGENEELQLCMESEGSLSSEEESTDVQDSPGLDIWNKNNTISSLRGISSYDAFLEHLDQQLNKIEIKLVTVLEVSTLVLDSEEKPKNSKVQQTVELLESIRGIRQRITSNKEAKVGIR
ncbi:Forkhead-associated domain protein [Quillaja saponaria]|uniref:Forkhead-associated domain protein n=1 Tax=Quillaja saponaria TaxID=32244 RepID=A0AAD7LVG2_QUISA|nr:Forkhead-associated domain protein [Quillaja saponaria]